MWFYGIQIEQNHSKLTYLVIKPKKKGHKRVKIPHPVFILCQKSYSLSSFLIYELREDFLLEKKKKSQIVIQGLRGLTAQFLTTLSAGECLAFVLFGGWRGKFLTEISFNVLFICHLAFQLGVIYKQQIINMLSSLKSF